MRNLRSGLAAGLLALAAGLAVGCGGNSSTADVSGTVMVDGKAVNGSIGFTPTDGKTSTSGGEIKDGKYAFKAPVGTMKVEIRVPKITGKKKLYDTPDSPYQDVMEETLPDKYNNSTELTFEVKAGKNEKNWELGTKK